MIRNSDLKRIMQESYNFIYDITKGKVFLAVLTENVVGLPKSLYANVACLDISKDVATNLELAQLGITFDLVFNDVKHSIHVPYKSIIWIGKPDNVTIAFMIAPDLPYIPVGDNLMYEHQPRLKIVK